MSSLSCMKQFQRDRIIIIMQLNVLLKGKSGGLECRNAMTSTYHRPQAPNGKDFSNTIQKMISEVYLLGR